MPTPKKSGQYTVRTAHPGDVFELTPELRIDDQGTWAGDKLRTLSEADAQELVQLAAQHSVPVVVTEPESESERSGSSAETKE